MLDKMRTIKFRAWDKILKKWRTDITLNLEGELYIPNIPETEGKNYMTDSVELVEFTGLKDKNDPCKEIYEGDIIDSNGKVKGNIYEMDKGKADLVVEGFGIIRKNTERLCNQRIIARSELEITKVFG